jgi:tripartite-type tricarboxylate transporter receptor subunit TctC
MYRVSRRWVLQSSASLASGLAMPATAQTFMGPDYTPADPIRIVVPFAPGGRSGFVARRLVAAMHEVLGQTVVLEHRTGNPLREIENFQSAPADGRTLLLAMVRLPRRGIFTADKDNAMLQQLSPVAVVAREPLALVLSTHSARALGIDSLAQLLRHMRQHPGKLSIATGSNGGTSHLAAELFKSMSQTYITRMAGAGTGPDLGSVYSGQTDLMFEGLHLLRNAVSADVVRLLAITSTAAQGVIDWDKLHLKTPVPFLHTAPGLQGYAMYDYHTLFAPPGIAGDAAALAYRQCAMAIAQTEFRATLTSSLALPGGDSAAEFLALEDQEAQRWQRARDRW